MEVPIVSAPAGLSDILTSLNIAPSGIWVRSDSREYLIELLFESLLKLSSIVQNII